MTFRDRGEAGRVLAQALTAYHGREDLLILGLARGGVPVGWEVAAALRAPLDVFLVRKLGVPQWEELAMGALASGGGLVVNDNLMKSLGIGEQALRDTIDRETDELNRREQAYRGDRPAADPKDKVAIIVDDGIATGASMLAAVRAVRSAQPASVVVAVPVGPPSACKQLEPRGRRCGVRDDARVVRSRRTGLRRLPPGLRRRGARTAGETDALARVAVFLGDLCGVAVDGFRWGSDGFVVHHGRSVVRVVLGEFLVGVLRRGVGIRVGFAAGPLPQRIDDQQHDADDAGGDADPGDQLIARDDRGHQGREANDGEHEGNDQQWSIPTPAGQRA